MQCCSTDGDCGVPVLNTDGSRTRPRRGTGAIVRWGVPIAALALIPKCPACVAAYVLLFTGIGLSFPAAAAVRWALIALSLAALTFLFVRAARRALRPHRAP